MVIAVVLFIGSIGAAGFVVAWQHYLIKAREEAKVVLAKNQQQFNPPLIETLKKADTKITLAKTLMSRHLAVSNIFEIIGRLTAENIRFTSLDFSAPVASGAGGAKDGIKVTLRGVGTSFSAIAFQSSVFGRSSEYGTNKVIKNPILSDLTLESNGSVGFTFTAMINPDDILYSGKQ